MTEQSFQTPEVFQRNMILRQLEPEFFPTSCGEQGDTLYRWEELKNVPGIRWHVLRDDHCYAVSLLGDNRITIDFAILQWVSEDDKGPQVTPFWIGSGTGSTLRELRHSNFGEDGYLSYADLDAFEAAVTWLRTLFN